MKQAVRRCDSKIIWPLFGIAVFGVLILSLVVQVIQ